MPSYSYSDGTISVTYGSNVVVGVGTAFSTQVKPADLILAKVSLGSSPEQFEWRIVGVPLSVTDDLNIVLQDDYLDDDLDTVEYRIIRGIAWWSGAAPNETLVTFLTELGALGLAGVTTGTPDPLVGRENEIRIDADAAIVYQKRAGVWEVVIFLTAADIPAGNESPAQTIQEVLDSLQEGLDSLTGIWVVAGGTADAITATYPTTVVDLPDGLILGFRALFANETSTPTYAPDGHTAHPITKAGGNPLVPGDIPGALAEVLVRYNLANTQWELLNPAPLGVHWVAAGGTVNAITAAYDPAIITLTDGLLVGVRAAGANTVVAPTFSPNSLTAHPITRLGGVALMPGGIYGANHELLLRYNLANTRWEVLNPAVEAPLLFKSLASDDTGADVNTAQPWFPTAGGVALAAGTYKFKGLLYLSRAAGTTSHTTGILFGGTAVLTSIDYKGKAKTGDTNALAGISGFFAIAATSLVLKAASTSATEQAMFEVEGVVVVGTAGTFIPQFIYSAAPGGAPTIKRGTRFEMQPVINPQGAWS